MSQGRIGTTGITVERAAEAEAQHAIDINEAHSGGLSRTNYLIEVANRSGLFVAYADGSPVGFACLDDRHFFRTPFVSLLVVHPDHRRLGIGQALVDRLQREAIGKRLFTSTNQSNGPMMAFLKTNGFVLCGQVQGLDEGDPELIYFKDL